MRFVELQRHISRLNSVTSNSINKTPIILSDSKGRYLQQKVANGFDQNIVFWHKSGATCREQFNFLKNNIDEAVEQYTNIVLYVWLGNCDLTVKENCYIKLRSHDTSAIKTITDCFKEIFHFISGYPTVELVFLEIPPYSVHIYNVSQQEKKLLKPFSKTDLKRLVDSDYELYGQIEQVNGFIRDTNRLTRKRSPRFGLDLENCRRGRYQGSRYTYRFDSFYTDGIHPCAVLSRYWLLNLCKIMLDDCN